MPARRDPIGILGGTFDPIHHGHLRLAEEVADACRLEQVRLVPAALPNLRAAPRTPAEHRLAMARLAAADNPRLAIDDRELKRAGTSYTVDTLTELRGQLGDERPLVLILGADAFLKLPAWSRWQRLLELAHIAVATRPGLDLDGSIARSVELRDLWQARRALDPSSVGCACAGSIVAVEIPLLEISATAIRARLARGASARYLLPRAVLDYIAAHRLYEDQ